jgi:hypothetical protein
MASRGSVFGGAGILALVVLMETYINGFAR